VGITTHVLDTALGRPAAGVAVVLEQETAAGEWRAIGGGETDLDGRLRPLLSDASPAPGVYRLVFDTRSYFARRDIATFFPSITVAFEIPAEGGRYHVPVLLSPFGYSTYRGS
jgi:5-hydroxyisourate hydrolase